MIGLFRAYRCKRWLRERGYKLAVSVDDFGKDAVLLLEEGASVGHVLPGFERLQIGALTYIRSRSELINVASIGRFCSIGNGVVIGQERAGHPLDWVSSHPFQYTGTALSYEPKGEAATIDHDVWIGRDAVVMEGVRVGTGAAIAARSVVTRDVPPYAVVAGMPAKIVRFRHAPEVVGGLLESAWWELPVDVMRQLPLDRPEQFLREIAALPGRRAAQWKRVEVRRGGCRELRPA